jgi:hypothetical protein
MNSKVIFKKWSLLAVAVLLLIAALATAATPILASSTPVPITATLVVGKYEPGTANTYLDVRINGGPIKAGWCVEYNAFITSGRTYTATIYNYLGQYYPDYIDELPATVQAVDWFAVTYIINHKIGTWSDVQNALWYITDGIPYTPGSNTETMVVNAQNYLSSNGGVYIPEDGGIAPMVCYTPGNQLIFFEYSFTKPSEPLPELPTALLFGLGLLGIGGFIMVKRHNKVTAGK